MLPAVFFRNKVLRYRAQDHLRLAASPSTSKIAERVLLEMVAFHISFWASRGFFRMQFDLPLRRDSSLEMKIIAKHSYNACREVRRILTDSGYTASIAIRRSTNKKNPPYIRAKISWLR